VLRPLVRCAPKSGIVVRNHTGGCFTVHTCIVPTHWVHVNVSVKNFTPLLTK
jgi:hypothetical protein